MSSVTSHMNVPTPSSVCHVAITYVLQQDHLTVMNMYTGLRRLSLPRPVSVLSCKC